ncbi:phage tail protein [Sorangium sp. So ce1151]|uniref:phage tail protein n=1 Tax=Sorangium sp. So ce1151 TaxID=3133332 RepID=UPI003F641FF7
MGSVVAFAGTIFGQEGAGVAATSTAPSGWMVCDGRKLHRAKFPELFAVIGYRYLQRGDKPGVIYRLPDLQGYFLRGVDPKGKVDLDYSVRKTPAHEDAVAPLVGSIQGCALQAHEHTYCEPTRSGATPGDSETLTMIKTEKNTTKTVVQIPAGLLSDNETRAVNVGVYYIIKFTNGRWPWTAPFGGAFGG